MVSSYFKSIVTRLASEINHCIRKLEPSKPTLTVNINALRVTLFTIGLYLPTA